MDSETDNARQTRQGKRGGGRAYHSRLEPFVEFIREQRQQRKTWQEIAERLGSEKGCRITFQGLHQFYRRHLKRRARPHWEDGAAQPARPDLSGDAPVPRRKAATAAVPVSRPFRRPNPDAITLNDPTKL